MVDWQAYQKRLLKDPKYREAWRDEQRLQLAQRRENYVKLLGFTPEQADAAIDLAIDRQMKWPGGIPQEQGEEEMRAYQAKLREVLGEESTRVCKPTWIAASRECRSTGSARNSPAGMYCAMTR